MLPTGQVSVSKHGEVLWLPLRIVGERTSAREGLEYWVQWQGTRDCSWERANAMPFPKLNQTWADTRHVEQYLRAKKEGRLQGEVCALTSLFVPKQRGGKGGVRVKLRLAVLNAPDDAPVDFDREAGEAVAETRLTNLRFEIECEERESKVAKEAVSQLPWALRFGIMASADCNLEDLARHDDMRRMLKNLANESRVRGPSDVRRVMEQYGKQPLRVPVREEGEALIYTAVIGRDEDGKWGVRRYEGPHAQNATKLTREAGCANLLSVRIEEPTERRMHYQLATSLESDDGESTTLTMLSELHELLQARTIPVPPVPPVPSSHLHLTFAHPRSCSLDFHRQTGLNVGGRQFSYLAHKIEHNAQDAKLVFVAVGKSVIVQPASRPGGEAATSSAAAPSQHWSCAGGSLLGRWETADECRALFADFDSLEVPAKIAKRLQLLFSPTTQCLEQVWRGSPPLWPCLLLSGRASSSLAVPRPLWPCLLLSGRASSSLAVPPFL